MCISKVKQNVVEFVKDMWLMLLHTLRGKYEAIIGELEVVFRKQQHIREIWKKAKVFTYFGERIKWRYAPPRWFFPIMHEGFCYSTSWLMWV